jgi:peptidoglycan hydrolase-like protein with peptidoglycan-binding domain
LEANAVSRVEDEMVDNRNALPVLFMSATLLAGCQTAQSPGASDWASGNVGSTQVESTTPSSSPAAATPGEAAQTDMRPDAAASEPAGYVSMSTVEVQRRLTQLGYHPGPVDGIDGPKTTSALRQFQHDHDLAMTGTVDGETIRELDKSLHAAAH